MFESFLHHVVGVTILAIIGAGIATTIVLFCSQQEVNRKQ
jgi:hypothetical protein